MELTNAINDAAKDAKTTLSNEHGFEASECRTYLVKARAAIETAISQVDKGKNQTLAIIATKVLAEQVLSVLNKQSEKAKARNKTDTIHGVRKNPSAHEE